MVVRSETIGSLLRPAFLLAALFIRPETGLAQSAEQKTPPAPTPTFKVEVIETTPLPGLDLKLDQIPAPVQTAVSADFEASGALDLSDFLNRRFIGVFINEMQGNPGFTSTGAYVARALPPIQGQFPVPQATLYAPGAPATIWVGIRVRF